MNRKAVLKVILLVIMGIVLLAKPINVFAVSSNPTDLNDFWEDQGSLDDIQQDGTTTPTTPEPDTTTPTTPEPDTTTTPEPEVTTPTTPEPDTTTPTTNNTNTDKELPKAGLVEDTMMIVSILALIGVAVFTFIKISDYSNI